MGVVKGWMKSLAVDTFEKEWIIIIQSIPAVPCSVIVYATICNAGANYTNINFETHPRLQAYQHTIFGWHIQIYILIIIRGRKQFFNTNFHHKPLSHLNINLQKQQARWPFVSSPRISWRICRPMQLAALNVCQWKSGSGRTNCQHWWPWICTFCHSSPWRQVWVGSGALWDPWHDLKKHQNSFLLMFSFTLSLFLLFLN